MLCVGPFFLGARNGEAEEGWEGDEPRSLRERLRFDPEDLSEGSSP